LNPVSQNSRAKDDLSFFKEPCGAVSNPAVSSAAAQEWDKAGVMSISRDFGVSRSLSELAGMAATEAMPEANCPSLHAMETTQPAKTVITAFTLDSEQENTMDSEQENTGRLLNAADPLTKQVSSLLLSNEQACSGENRYIAQSLPAVNSADRSFFRASSGVDGTASPLLASRGETGRTESPCTGPPITYLDGDEAGNSDLNAILDSNGGADGIPLGSRMVKATDTSKIASTTVAEDFMAADDVATTPSAIAGTFKFTTLLQDANWG
jgi:hypothetical protein